MRVDVGVHARVRLHVCIGGVRVHLRAGVDVDAGTSVGRGRRGGSSSSSRALSSGALGSKLSIVALRCDGSVVLLLRGQSLGCRVPSWERDASANEVFNALQKLTRLSDLRGLRPEVAGLQRAKTAAEALRVGLSERSAGKSEDRKDEGELHGV